MESPQWLNRQIRITGSYQSQTTTCCASGIRDVDKSGSLPAGWAEALKTKKHSTRFKACNQWITKRNQIELIRFGMHVSLNRSDHGSKCHRAADINHLADCGKAGDVKSDIHGGVAIERLEGATPATWKRRRKHFCPGNRIETLHLSINLQRDRQLNGIERKLWTALKRQRTAYRKIHGKQERHGELMMMAAR